MEWTKAPAGVINAATQRFWGATADKADAVAEAMVDDPDFLGSIAAFAIEKAKSRPRVIDLGEFVVDYDETIAAKLLAVTDPKAVGWRTDWATDEKFPDARTGTKRYKASAVYFGRQMSDEDVETWCKAHGKKRATPKEGIDLARVSPRPKLDGVMPLALVGQFFVDADGDRDALYFRRSGDGRGLSYVWLFRGVRWDAHWWFLVLEELPLEA